MPIYRGGFISKLIPTFHADNSQQDSIRVIKLGHFREGLSLLFDGDHPGLAAKTHLADARRLVSDYQAMSAEQFAVQAQILAFVDSHSNALWRTCETGHLTGSAVVFDAMGARTLLMAHKKLRRWLQPGGHADGDANLARVAWREATEETGIADLKVYPRPIDLDIHWVETAKEPGHNHLDVRFLVVAPPEAVAVGNHESHGLAWVDLVDIANPRWALDEGTLRLVESATAAFHRLG